MSDYRYNNSDKSTEENYQVDINSYADAMLARVTEIVQELIKDCPKTKSAIVDSVNQDGTVNVKLPSDNSNVYTRIQNQSIWQNLVPGDGVELFLKDGTFSNCWIIAKHVKQN